LELLFSIIVRDLTRTQWHINLGSGSDWSRRIVDRNYVPGSQLALRTTKEHRTETAEAAIRS
jgi:hypothetical protein